MVVQELPPHSVDATEFSIALPPISGASDPGGGGGLLRVWPELETGQANQYARWNA